DRALGFSRSLAPGDESDPSLPSGPDDIKVEETTVTLSISDALRAHSCLVVIGAPGAGKTTLLKYLALAFARQQAKERLDLAEERLPVFLALRDFSRFLDGAGPPTSDAPALLRFLHEHVRALAPHLQLPPDFFPRLLADRRCAILLDGLDEVANPLQRARIAEGVAAFMKEYGGKRFVLTSRPRGLQNEAGQRLASPF